MTNDTNVGQDQISNTATINKRNESLTLGGVRFEFPYWDLLPRMADWRDEIVTREMKKSVDTWGVREPVTVKLPADSVLEIVDQELQFAYDDPDVIDVGGSIPKEQALASTRYQPTVEVFHGEVRLRAARAEGLNLSEIPFQQYQEYDDEQIEKIDQVFKGRLRNEKERNLYDSLPASQKERLRAFSELIERDIRSKNGLATEVRGLFVSIIDRIWVKLGFDVMPQRAVADICAVQPRTIGRDRDDHLADTDSSYESLMDRIETLYEERSQVASAMRLLRRYSDDLGREDHIEGDRILKKLKGIINDKLEERRQQKRDLANQIYDQIADGTDHIFGHLNQHAEAEEMAAEKGVEELPDPTAEEGESVTNVTDTQGYDDLVVDGSLSSSQETDSDPEENENEAGEKA